MKRVILLSISGFSALSLAGIFLVIPPVSGIIAVTIALSAVFVFSGTALILPLQKALLLALFILIFLGMNAFIGFDLLNTAILLCFIIGVDRLLS
ncbi:MAG: hypothetical protein N2691_03150 [Patescibacteria group bacterium]|nr:hypothetical protein [Patescibacteria group bacterium]